MVFVRRLLIRRSLATGAREPPREVKLVLLGAPPGQRWDWEAPASLNHLIKGEAPDFDVQGDGVHRGAFPGLLAIEGSCPGRLRLSAQGRAAPGARSCVYARYKSEL